MLHLVCGATKLRVATGTLSLRHSIVRKIVIVAPHSRPVHDTGQTRSGSRAITHHTQGIWQRVTLIHHQRLRLFAKQAAAGTTGVGQPMPRNCSINRPAVVQLALLLHEVYLLVSLISMQPRSTPAMAATSSSPGGHSLPLTSKLPVYELHTLSDILPKSCRTAVTP